MNDKKKKKCRNTVNDKQGLIRRERETVNDRGLNKVFHVRRDEKDT